MNQIRLTCEQQIIALLGNRGPMTVRDMRRFIPYRYQTIYAKTLKLEAEGFVERYKNDMWSLKPGVLPVSYTSREKASCHNTPTSSENSSLDTESASFVLDPKDKFIETMKAIGVSPADAIPTIADIFFSEDIDNVKWLDYVLSKEAAGFVMPHQRQLMIAWWAYTRGLNYDEIDLEDEASEYDEQEKRKTEECKQSHPMDLGFGWRIGKNKSGDWVPIQGGPLTYEQAARYAQKRAIIKSYMRQYRVR